MNSYSIAIMYSFFFFFFFLFFFFFFFFFNDTATTEIYTSLFVGSVRCVRDSRSGVPAGYEDLPEDAANALLDPYK